MGREPLLSRCAIGIDDAGGGAELIDVATGKVTKMNFPALSNVLQYFTEDGTKVSVRPSGTEPKIKFYIEVQAPLANRADYNAVEAKANTKIEAVRASLGV